MILSDDDKKIELSIVYAQNELNRLRLAKASREEQIEVFKRLISLFELQNRRNALGSRLIAV